MVVIKSALLEDEHLIICTSNNEYWKEIEHHGNMVIYHPLELEELRGLNDDGIKTMHEVKKVFSHIGNIVTSRPPEIEPEKISMAAMRKKIWSNGK